MRSFSSLTILLIFVLSAEKCRCHQPKSSPSLAVASSFSLKEELTKKNQGRKKGRHPIAFFDQFEKKKNDIADHNNIIIHRGGADKKVSDFKVRAASAIIVLSGLYLLLKNTGKQGIIVLVIGCQVGMFDEVMNVSGVSSPVSKLLALVTNLVFWDGKHLFSSDKRALVNLIAFGMIGLHIITLVVSQNNSAEDKEFGKSLKTFCSSQLSAALIIGASSSWLATLNAYNVLWIIFPGLLVIINDTMAYICGRLFGKHPLLPKISPKKTWEGFLGAAISTIALTKPIWNLLNTNGSSATILDTKHLYIIALYVSFVAPFGGFLASTIKRTFGYKDFGAVMPGHGGLVDRLDCQLLTAPFVYLYLTLTLGATGGCGGSEIPVQPAPEG